MIRMGKSIRHKWVNVLFEGLYKLGQSSTRTVGIASNFQDTCREIFRNVLKMHFDQAIIHLSKSLNFIFIKFLQITSFVNVLEVPSQNFRLQK